jgi:ABC-type glycerol-3-phosphate transport system substrate-binding protein
MNTKRFVSTALVIALLVGTMFFVVSPTDAFWPFGDDEEKVKTINFMNMRYGGTSILNEKMKEVAEEMENVEAYTKSVGWGELEKQSKVILSAGGTSPFEILQAYNGWMPGYINNEWITPLTPYYEKYKDEYNLNDIPQELWDVVSHEGEIYGFPFQQNLQHTFYRKDIFKKYDLEAPKTFEELFNVLETLKQKADTEYQYALALSGKSGVATEFNNALRAYEGKWFSADNKPLFNSEEGVKAVKLLKKLMDYMPQEVLSYSNNNVSVALQQGIVPMANLWTSRAAEVEDESVSQFPDKFAYAAPPSSIEGGTPYTNWTQDMLVIPKETSVDKELIFEVMAKSLTKEKQKAFAAHAIVSRSSIAEDEEIVEKYPNYAVVNQTIKNGAKSYPIKPYFGEERLIVGKYVSKALAGQMTAEEALEQAEKEVVEDMKEKGYL